MLAEVLELLNVAVSVVFPFTVTLRGLLAEMTVPVHPVKAEPDAGVAERETPVPALTDAGQAAVPQVAETVPAPVPALLTVRL